MKAVCTFWIAIWEVTVEAIEEARKAIVSRITPVLTMRGETNLEGCLPSANSYRTNRIPRFHAAVVRDKRSLPSDPGKRT